MLRSTDAFYKLTAGLMCPLAQIATAVVDLVDVQEYLQCAAQVDAEPTEQRLPEGVLLHALDLVGAALEHMGEPIDFTTEIVAVVIITIRVGGCRKSILLRNVAWWLLHCMWHAKSAESSQVGFA